MAYIFIPYVARVNCLKIIRAGITGGAYDDILHYHLFKSNITPALADTLSTYSAQEADFDGYAVKNVVAWTVPTLNDDDIAFMIGTPALTWQHDGGATSNTVYGGYVTNEADDELLWVEKFTTSKAMADLPDILTVVPRLTLEHILAP